jgi:hypothetical protein
MDPVIGILVPGFVGGLVIAAVVLLLQRRRGSAESVVMPYRRDPVTTDIINMASIKVAGVGGLGLVAMAVAVALDVPRIAQSLGIGLVLGAIGAAIVIARRRKSDPMPSAGRGMGANTMLALDDVPSPGPTDPPSGNGDTRLAAHVA